MDAPESGASLGEALMPENLFVGDFARTYDRPLGRYR